MPAPPEQVKAQLRDFICRAILRRPTYPLGDDEPLVTSGILDSMSAVNVAAFIERAFGVSIANTDLTVENLETLNRIVARVLRG